MARGITGRGNNDGLPVEIMVNDGGHIGVAILRNDCTIQSAIQLG